MDILSKASVFLTLPKLNDFIHMTQGINSSQRPNKLYLRQFRTNFAFNFDVIALDS